MAGGGDAQIASVAAEEESEVAEGELLDVAQPAIIKKLTQLLSITGSTNHHPIFDKMEPGDARIYLENIKDLEDKEHSNRRETKWMVFGLLLSILGFGVYILEQHSEYFADFVKVVGSATAGFLGGAGWTKWRS